MGNYAVVGNPVQHSLSPRLHEAFARQRGICLCYRALTVELDEWPTAVLKAKLNGCNVTAPFKEKAFQLATELSPAAQQARAVNCLTFISDHRIVGDNFDGVGLLRALTQHHHVDLAHKKILILGAGGAVRGILFDLLQQKPCDLVLLNRTPTKAQALADYFAPHGVIRSAENPFVPRVPYDLVIDATSDSTASAFIALPKAALHTNTFCLTLAYGVMAKNFLAAAKKKGVSHTADGFSMLLEQAAASFHRWHGIYPDTQSRDVHLL